MKIKNLRASTVLGIYDWEKQAKRMVVLNLELHITDTKSGDSNQMKDAVDYAMIEERVIKHMEITSYNLLERLVTDIGTYILTLDKRIAKVTVEADKLGALRQSDSVAVSRTFDRSFF